MRKVDCDRDLHLKIYEYAFKDVKYVWMSAEHRMESEDSQWIYFSAEDNKGNCFPVWWGCASHRDGEEEEDDELILKVARVDVPLDGKFMRSSIGRLMSKDSNDIGRWLMPRCPTPTDYVGIDEVKSTVGREMCRILEWGDGLVVTFGYNLRKLVDVKSLDELLVKMDLEMGKKSRF